MINYTYGNYGFIKHERMQNQPLFLIDAGIEHRDNTQYYYDNNNRSAFNGYLIQYTLSGNGVFVKNNERYSLKQGDAFFVKIPENSCYYFDSSTASDWDFFYLHFDGDSALPFYETIVKLTNGVFHIGTDKAPLHLFFSFIDNYVRKGFLELYEGGEFVYRFLSGILREIEAPSENTSSQILAATRFMRDNFASIGSISEVADICNISTEHFCRCFKKEKGHSPLQFLNKLRIEHALFLLLNTTSSIEEIATACGFMNGNYFAKVFKKYMLCTPGEYRIRS
ncbi:MAG: helix-turn-helix domain-containing protein [Lachnospiraceae bacterium]|nr:helix-turn-helix domain-containing protein [Lachnospiraceae bacterium]